MENEDAPYQPVVQEVHKLIEQSSPLNKLESIGKCKVIDSLRTAKMFDNYS